MVRRRYRLAKKTTSNAQILLAHKSITKKVVDSRGRKVKKRQIEDLRRQD